MATLRDANTRCQAYCLANVTGAVTNYTTNLVKLWLTDFSQGRDATQRWQKLLSNAANQ